MSPELDLQNPWEGRAVVYAWGPTMGVGNGWVWVLVRDPSQRLGGEQRRKRLICNFHTHTCIHVLTRPPPNTRTCTFTCAHAKVTSGFASGHVLEVCAIVYQREGETFKVQPNELGGLKHSQMCAW